MIHFLKHPQTYQHPSHRLVGQYAGTPNRQNTQQTIKSRRWTPSVAF